MTFLIQYLVSNGFYVVSVLISVDVLHALRFLAVSQQGIETFGLASLSLPSRKTSVVADIRHGRSICKSHADTIYTPRGELMESYNTVGAYCIYFIILFYFHFKPPLVNIT